MPPPPASWHNTVIGWFIAFYSTETAKRWRWPDCYLLNSSNSWILRIRRSSRGWSRWSSASSTSISLSVWLVWLRRQVSGGRWQLGDALCDTWIAFDVLCCTASILNLAAISFDRSVTQSLTSTPHWGVHIGYMYTML